MSLQLLPQLKDAHEFKLAAKDKELAALEEQMQQAQVELNENKSLLSVAKERAGRYENVADILPKSELEAAKSEVISLESNIGKAEHRLSELTQQLERVRHEKEDLSHSFKATRLEQLAEREKVATELLAKRDELSFKHKKQPY